MARPFRASAFKASWTELLQVGAWLVAVILLFVLVPPRLTPAEDGLPYVRATEFVAAILIVLCVVAVRRGKPRVRVLWAATLFSLVPAVAALFGHLALRSDWTCEYDGRGPVVIGSEMLPEARGYSASLGHPGCRRMIEDSAGDTSAIWDDGELRRRHLVLAGTFMGTVLLFALAAMLAVETYRAAGRPSARRRQ